MAYFRRRDRRFSALDTLQPIAMLVVALIEMDLVGTNNAIQDFWIAGNERLRGRAPLCPGSVGVTISSRLTKI